MYDIKKTIQDSIEIKSKMIDSCIEDIQSSSTLMYKAIMNGKKVLWCGNGGSAADAQHMAAELMGGLVSHDRPPISSIALTTDTSFITAWTNDTDYSTIFSRQIEGLGEEGDILIAISTSGNSLNVIKAIKAAEEKEMMTIILKGSSETVPFSSTIFKSLVISMCFSLNFSRTKTAVKGVAKILHFN